MSEHGHLHIYGQDCWHSEAFILGDTEGLKALRDAIDKALATGQGFASAFVNDGEGFFTAIAQVDKDTLDKLAVPYTDKDIGAREHREEALWPWAYPPIRQACKEAEAWIDAEYSPQEAKEIHDANEEDRQK